MAVDQDAQLRGGQATGGRVLTARGLRTRSNLVAAAKQVFETTPFSETRIADITALAGAATGTFYTYFDSKEAIFREVAAGVLAEMSAAPRRDPENTDGDPIRDIAHASREYFRACLRNAGVARSIEQLTGIDRDVANTRRSILVGGVKRAERWIRHLQEQGVCDMTIDPWTTAMALHTMNVRVAYDHLLPSADETKVESMVEAVTHIWARAVGLEHVEARPDR